MRLFFIAMRYHYEPPKLYTKAYNRVYICDHPVYSRCTLFTLGDFGLAVIQQRYDPITKCTWWEEIDPWLAKDIYMHEKFRDVFEQFAGSPENDIYPTITVRQFMWRLKMKPIKREVWETCFDHAPILQPLLCNS